jgi:hypothetical protein
MRGGRGIAALLRVAVRQTVQSARPALWIVMTRRRERCT